MSSRQTRLREMLLLGGLCGFFFFFRLSGIGLLGPDEPRYAQIAREMLVRGDWVTPTLYHHTWLEKPILLYWGEMLAYAATFDVSDWAARLPSALAATVLVLGTFLGVRRIRRQARLDAALMVASSLFVLGFARAASPDMLLASTWCLSLLAWFCWYQANLAEDPSGGRPSGRAKPYLYLFYALNALAMLAKGPVAPVLAAFVLTLFCFSQRNPRALLRTLSPAGIALFLAVAAPWYVLVQLRTPEFFRVFIVQHNLARFGSNLYRHKQPFWFYLPVALAATLPWTVWLLHGVADAVTALRSTFRRTNHPPIESGHSFTFEIFLLLWALVPIAFFSISHSKLPGYILPSIPALLILAAVAVHRREAREERPRWTSIAAHAVLLATLAGTACLIPQLAFKLPLSASRLMLAALAGTAVFFVAALPLLLAGWRYLHFVTLLPMIVIVGYILRGFAPALDATQSARPVGALLQRLEEHAGLPIATFGLRRNTAFGLAFYLDRRIDPYEGLEISPAVYELPPAVPAEAHLLVTREGQLPALRQLLSGRSLIYLGSYAPQHMEIFQVSAAPVSAAPPRVP